MSLFDDDFSVLRDFYLICTGQSELAKSCLTGVYLDPNFGLHYRPLLYLQMLAIYKLFGINSLLLHMAGILIHALNSFLVFAVGLRIFRSLGIRPAFSVSLWSATMFAVHPFHAESLNWFCAGVDLLFTSWYLLCLWCFGEFLASGNRVLYAIAVTSCLFALCTKETAVSLPFVLTVLALLKNGDPGGRRIGRAARQVWVFFLVLVAFWAVRSACLQTYLGSYVGSLTGDWLGTFSQRFIEANVLQVLFYPVCRLSAFADLLSAGLALVYLAIAAFLLYDLRAGRADSHCLFALSFVFAFMAFAFAPVLYVWCPSSDLNGSHLLYLPCIGLCWLSSLVLFAASPEKASVMRPAAAAVLVVVLTCSLFERHCSWLSAGRISRSLIEKCASHLKEDSRNNRRLVLVTMPNRVNGVSAFYTFYSLLSAFKMPFTAEECWQRLGSMEPHYYGDTTLVPLSRLRELAVTLEENEVCDCDVDFKKNTVELHAFDVGRFADKPPPEELVISRGQLLCLAEKKGVSTTIPLPRVINSADYQFLKIKLQSRIKSGRYLRLFFKSPGAGKFALPLSREYSLSAWQNRNEVTIHLGELLDWLRCQQVDSLAVSSDAPLNLESVTLLPDVGLVPCLRATPGKNKVLLDGTIIADKGDFYFDYDASALRGAAAVRLELAPPGVWLSSYSHTYRDSSFSTHTQKVVELNSVRGTLCLRNDAPQPIWQQVRLFSVTVDGRPIGYSSDPLYVQSGLRP